MIRLLKQSINYNEIFKNRANIVLRNKRHAAENIRILVEIKSILGSLDARWLEVTKLEHILGPGILLSVATFYALNHVCLSSENVFSLFLFHFFFFCIHYKILRNRKWIFSLDFGSKTRAKETDKQSISSIALWGN